MPAKNKLSLVVQYADPRLQDTLSRGRLRRWAQAALQAPAELTIRLVDAEECRALNRDYRGKDYATNVLTFVYNDDKHAIPQADIVLCTDVLKHEANAQHKSIEAHAAHLVVHGVLHAQGYDHETDEDADAMEAIEVEVLKRLGLENPYRSRQDLKDR